MASAPMSETLPSDPIPDQAKCKVCGEYLHLEPIALSNDGTGGVWWVWVHTRYVYNRTHPAEPVR